MPETSQLTFTYQEVLESLVKQANLHEGRWQLVMTFGMTATNIGLDHRDLVPGAAIAISGVGLQKATPESPANLTIDAAKVNPSST